MTITPAPPTRRHRHFLGLVSVMVTVALAGAACGDDEEGATSSTTSPAQAADATTTAVASGATYTPVSDVTSHAAIGKDVAAIKELLAVAKENKPVDWTAVDGLFTNGGASKKSDGSVRTLATLLDAPDDIAFVKAAIAGGESDAVRAQSVEKGITVLLARKVLQEFDAADAKLADGKTAPADGAPHNVDEAWAFYVAEGNGPSSTAQKRAADFGLDGEVDEAVLAALNAGLQAAADGDRATLAAAKSEVASAINFIFYLATYKYLDTQNDAARKAEGIAFYRGIAPTLKAEAASAHQAIEGAFSSGDIQAGRGALNSATSLAALDLDTSQVVAT